MGGSAREWTRVLDEDLEPGSTVQLDIVMTKFLDPAVSIGWAVRVEDRPLGD